ncbi:MAG: histidine kinase dimerization/phospho-acceptor domain-containing protein [Acidobacteriota bacterium]|nr:histidine kinase dimerization/phospho-acceptor domain-containing protein [Acidobacteriota bacterium]
MSEPRRFPSSDGEAYQAALPDLRELSRVHDVSLELIEKSHDLDELLGVVLTEYERRLRELPDDALDPGNSPPDSANAVKIRALVMFATQATALMAKTAETERRHRIEKLGEVMRTLGVLSHKINNPLTALMGRAQLLRMAKSDPKVVKAAEVIEESAGRIAELIRELARVVKEGREEGVEKLLELDVRGGGEVGAGS